MKEHKKKLIEDTISNLVPESIARTKAEDWVRLTFADDIIPSEQSGNDEDYIILCPHMEAGSWLFVLEYYTGIKHINTNSKGTGNGQMVRISKFLDLFSEIIGGNIITEIIINDLIEYSEEKKLGYSWYFRLILDKIQYENFVDIRKVFADLYSKYSIEADQSGRLQDILEANRKFKEFIKTEKQKELSEGDDYKKQFFSL